MGGSIRVNTLKGLFSKKKYGIFVRVTIAGDHFLLVSVTIASNRVSLDWGPDSETPNLFQLKKNRTSMAIKV